MKKYRNSFKRFMAGVLGIALLTGNMGIGTYAGEIIVIEEEQTLNDGIEAESAQEIGSFNNDSDYEFSDYASPDDEASSRIEDDQNEWPELSAAEPDDQTNESGTTESGETAEVEIGEEESEWLVSEDDAIDPELAADPDLLTQSLESEAEAEISEDLAAGEAISYTKRIWNNTEKTILSMTDTITEYTILENAGGNKDLSDSWVVVDKDTSIGGHLNIRGNVSLLICDGVTLTAHGIVVSAGNTLNIYGQSGDSGKVVTTGEEYCAGIGSLDEATTGTINIYGGTIEANGGEEGAGIGGGNEVNGGKISIYGGTITANGGKLGAGIGGGDECDAGTLNIYGGTITANGGKNAAGIGGGEGGNGGAITVHYAENLTAKGGENGAGIGGGDGGNGGIIIVHNAKKISAIGGEDAAGIGGGDDGSGGTITIYNSPDVYATSTEYGAGIGGGDGEDFLSFTMTDGTVFARGKYGAGIGAGKDEDFTGTAKISGGTLTAEASFTKYADYFESPGTYGAPIGAGNKGDFEGKIILEGGKITGQYMTDNGWFNKMPEKFGPGKGGDFAGTIVLGDGMKVHTNDNTFDGRERLEKLRSDPGTYLVVEACDHPAARSYLYDPAHPAQHVKECKYCLSSITEDHTFGSPVWTWAEDFSQATLTVPCTICQYGIDTVAQGDMITCEIDSSPASHGKRTYTANVVFDGKEYSDSRTIAIYDLSDADISGIESEYLGNGRELKPEPTVRMAGKLLTEGVDYTVTYSGLGISVGEYSLTISGMGDYTGSRTIGYNVIAKYAAASGTRGASDSENYQYLLDGKLDTKWYVKDISGTAYVEFSSSQVFRPTGYILSTANDSKRWKGRNPKTWVLKAKLRETDEWTTIASAADDLTLEAKNYESYRFGLQKDGVYKFFRFEVSAVQDNGKEFPLSELKLEGIPAGDFSSAYIGGVSSRYGLTGSEIKPVPTVTVADGFTLTAGKDYDVTYDGDGTVPGSYSLTVTAKAPFTGSLSVRYDVVEATEEPSKTHTVTFDPGKGEVYPSKMKTGEDGKLTEFPRLVRTGAVTEFEGWFDQNGKKITLDTVFTEDTTVTAQWYSAFAGYDLSLEGNIGVMFYLNLTEAQASGRSVEFNWTVFDENGNEVKKSASCKLEQYDADMYYVLCPVSVAEMICEIDASITIEGETFTESCSVEKVADIILTDEHFRKTFVESRNAMGKNGEQKLAQVSALMKEMLSYGAAAQVQFGRAPESPADRSLSAVDPSSLNYYVPEPVDAGMINTGAGSMSEGLADYGLEYEGSTLVYLSETSLRHYYRVTDPAKFEAIRDNITLDGEKCGYSTKDYRIYFEQKNIGAPDLDRMFTLKIGSTEYRYSVLDYVKECLSSDQASDTLKALAAATYRYNKAANVYFETEGGN